MQKTGSWKSVGLVSHSQHDSGCNKESVSSQKWHQCVCGAEQMIEVMPKLTKSDISVFVVQSKWQRWCPNWPKVTSLCLLCRANDGGDAQIGQKWHHCLLCRANDWGDAQIGQKWHHCLLCRANDGGDAQIGQKWHHCLLCRANDWGDAQIGQKWHHSVCCAEQMMEVMPKLAKSDITLFVVQSKWWRWCPNWPKVTSLCLLCRANDWGDAQIGQKWHHSVCCAEQMTEVTPKLAKRSKKSRKVKAKSVASTSMDVDEDVDKQDEGE